MVPFNGRVYPFCRGLRYGLNVVVMFNQRREGSRGINRIGPFGVLLVKQVAV